MKLFVAIAIIAAVSAKIGDNKPFCFWPEYFDTTVKPMQSAIDLNKYTGTWYEIARLDTIFQTNCACGEAHYTIEQKYFGIENVCIKTDGRRSVAKAKGYVKNSFNTFLKIYFNPLIGGNYFILDLDVNYQWVVIGTPCRDLFWILARESSISEDLLAEKLQLGRDLGFDLSSLILRKDTCNENLVNF